MPIKKYPAFLERVRGARGERENFFSREKKFSRFPRIISPYREQSFREKRGIGGVVQPPVRSFYTVSTLLIQQDRSMSNEYFNRSEEEWELEIRRDEKRINRYFHELPVCIDLPEEEEFIFSDISSIPELIPQNSSADELRRICRPDDDSDDDMHDGAHGDDENVCSVNDMAVDWAMLCVEKLCGALWNAGVGISCDFGKLIARIEEFNTSAENSDKNLSKMEDIFSIPELAPITQFIAFNQDKRHTSEVKSKQFELEKGGRIFDVECIMFQDKSFEISINDITQETEQARLKKQLTQNIAHELKTPVSSIQGYLETIVNNPGISKEKRDEFLSRIYAQSNRLTHLLRDISTLTRMEEAPNMTDKEPVDISLMLKGMLNEVALQLEEKQITVDNQIPNGLTVQGNPSMLYSIFRNLTDNTIAYAGTNIQITIKCFRQGEKYHYFSFADTGCGVSSEHLGRLFERFYRVDKGRSRKLGGTGLGLAIVKNAVLLHGGSIFAKNNPDGGLEFIFTLVKE